MSFANLMMYQAACVQEYDTEDMDVEKQVAKKSEDKEKEKLKNFFAKT